MKQLLILRAKAGKTTRSAFLLDFLRLRFKIVMWMLPTYTYNVQTSDPKKSDYYGLPKG